MQPAILTERALLNCRVIRDGAGGCCWPVDRVQVQEALRDYSERGGCAPLWVNLADLLTYLQHAYGTS